MHPWSELGSYNGDMENENLRQSTHFRILDVLLLTAGVSYSLAVLVPTASREPNGAIIAIAIVFGLTLAGVAITYPLWLLLPTRFTVTAANYLGYPLFVVVLGVVWDAEILGAIPLLAAGPLSFIGYSYPLLESFPYLTSAWDEIFIIGFLAVPMLAMMFTHAFRQNLIGVILSSLGAAVWYLAGFAAGLARIY